MITEIGTVSPKRSTWSFVEESDEADIRTGIQESLKDLEMAHAAAVGDMCCLVLYEPSSSIDSFDAGRLFDAIETFNGDRSRNIALFLTSQGGESDPAYQISKVCKAYARASFVVSVPRQAKSAATLIALGADEIHMGPLGELGPIDPQLNGLPALGVLQAVRLMASVAQEYPGSAAMLANYLAAKLDVMQVGYSERVAEAAAQYAERLLATKPGLSQPDAARIGRQLVYEYKDHGMVIDREEAAKLLGSMVVANGSTEPLARALYDLLDTFSLAIRTHKKKRLMVVGALRNATVVFM